MFKKSYLILSSKEIGEDGCKNYMCILCGLSTVVNKQDSKTLTQRQHIVSGMFFFQYS